MAEALKKIIRKEQDKFGRWRYLIKLVSGEVRTLEFDKDVSLEVIKEEADKCVMALALPTKAQRLKEVNEQIDSLTALKTELQKP